MRDNLEKFIEQNREDFNIYTPSDEIWNKIKKNNIPSKSRILSPKFLLRIAAVVIIFLTGFYIQEIRYNQQNKINIVKNNIIKSQLPPELKETENYYAHKVSTMVSEVEKYTKQDPYILDEVKTDLSELDSVYVDLKKDLKENASNKEIVEAMIQNYKIKIEILEELLFELKQNTDDISNQKQMDYEI